MYLQERQLQDYFLSLPPCHCNAKLCESFFFFFPIKWTYSMLLQYDTKMSRGVNMFLNEDITLLKEAVDSRDFLLEKRMHPCFYK